MTPEQLAALKEQIARAEGEEMDEDSSDGCNTSSSEDVVEE